MSGAVILGRLLERHERILPKLRGRGERQARAKQRTGKNRTGVTFLQGRIHSDSARDAGGETAGAVRVAQRVID